MLSLTELQNSDLDLDFIKEALSQAEKRLSDLWGTKKQLDLKSFILLYGSLFNVAVFFLVPFIGVKNLFFSSSITICGIGVLIAGILFCYSLRGFKYGNFGNPPQIWLTKENMGHKNALVSMLAYTTHHYQARIYKSIESNKKKAFFINIGLLFWGVSLVLFIISVLWTMIFPFMFGLD